MPGPGDSEARSAPENQVDPVQPPEAPGWTEGVRDPPSGRYRSDTAIKKGENIGSLIREQGYHIHRINHQKFWTKR